MQGVDQPYAILVASNLMEDLQDLIDYAKKNPGKIRYGSTGTNSIGQIYMEASRKREGLLDTHPFKGAATMPAMLEAHRGGTEAAAWSRMQRGKNASACSLEFKTFPSFPETLR